MRTQSPGAYGMGISDGHGKGRGDIHKELSWGFCSSVENDRVELPLFLPSSDR